MKVIRFLFTLTIFSFFVSFSLMAQEADAEEIILSKAEKMPRFPGCESEEDDQSEKSCADRKMLQFIYKNLEYPDEAKENETEGTVVVRFVVDVDGTIEDAEVIRGIGDGCDEAALEVVESMPNFHPGYQEGHPVRVYFNLPIRFRI